MISPFALVYLVAYAVPAAVGFLALILYTHLLSPEQYGLYVIGASVAGIIAAVFFAWIRLSVSRYQARSPELDLRAEATVAYGAAALVVTCLTPIALLIVRPDISLSIVAGSLLLALTMTAFEISQEFKRAKLNSFRFTVIALIRSVLGLVLGYTAIEFGGGGVGLLLAVGVSFLIANGLGFQRNNKPLRDYSVDRLTVFVRYGLPFSLGALAFALHGAVDRLAVAYLLGRSGAGYYGLAADMTRQLMAILAASVASAMFPLAFRSLAQAGPAATRERLKEGLELLLALVVPVAVWLAICADAIVGTLLGSAFQVSVAMLLPVLAIARMCGAINQYYLQVSFQLAEKPLLQVAHDAAILILNLAFLFPLTLAFGLPGTAAAVLLAEAFGIAFGIALSRKAFKLPLNGPGMVRVLASSSVLAVVTYAVRVALNGHGLLTLIGATGAGGLAYVASALLLDVAGIRTWIAASFWPRHVAAS